MRKSAVLLLCALLLTGCGSAPDSSTPDSSTVEVQLQTVEEAENTLTSQGWTVQSTTAASFHLWEQYTPQMLILAENSDEQVFIGAQFADEETALKAYDSVVPVSDESSTSNQDGDWYRQSLVTLPDEGGCWVFRQEGQYVLGGWIASQDEESGMLDTFASLQVSPKPETESQPKESISGDEPRSDS